MMRALLLVIALLAAAIAAPAAAAPRDGAQLEKVVVLSRHGVRAPTQSAKVLDLWSQKKWPEWPVGRGELTLRGARLVDAMWRSLGSLLKTEGILPDGMCPRQADVYIRADTDERTRGTAAALLAGIAPDCGLGYMVSDQALDPLFHPVKAGLYRYDAIRVASDVLGMLPGGLDGLQDEFSGAVSLMSQIIGSPASSLCARFALMPKCQLSDLPNAISIGPDGTSVRLVGSLSVASSIAEIFLLEYGEWPDALPGWGEVDARVLAQTLPVHSKVFDVVNRAPVVAWANGASLLSEMKAALFSEHPDKAVNDARLVVFVGHDTNIANVAGLLEYVWQASGYPPNGIPPAGALFLELWNMGGSHYVNARFMAQTPESLHAPFGENVDSGVHAPKEAVVFTSDLEAAYLEAASFRDNVENRIAGAPLAARGALRMFYGAPEASASTRAGAQ